MEDFSNTTLPSYDFKYMYTYIDAYIQTLIRKVVLVVRYSSLCS